MKLGDRIKQLLDERDMTQTELSSRAGLDENGKPVLPNATLSDIIKGTTSEGKISVGKILKIAEVLGVSVEFLFGREEPKGETLSRDERELLRLWRNATPSCQDTVDSVLRCNQLPIKKESAI